MAKLKVFRTPIGFHDAYVAAPSRKAALAAWGADADLFARGVAELVTDPKLMAEPLEKPGEVIRRVRGTAAEHIAALPPDRLRAALRKKPLKSGRSAASDVSRTAPGSEPPKPKAPNSKSADARPKPKPPKPPPKPKPRPSRAGLDALEEEMAALEARQSKQMRDIIAEQAELQRRKVDMERDHDKERAAVQARLDRAKEKLERALEGWRRTA